MNVCFIIVLFLFIKKKAALQLLFMRYEVTKNLFQSIISYHSLMRESVSLVEFAAAIERKVG